MPQVSASGAIGMTRPRFLLLAIVVVAAGAVAAQTQRTFDLVVRGGTVVDGSGRPGVRADVGVRDGTIAAIGRLDDARAGEAIDAAGLVVAPGFIDVHTHADDLVETPEAENFVRMGVTSVVAGNCGSSALDVGDALTRIRQVGVSVNFATLIGHNTVRTAVMGTANRAPDINELSRMKALVWKAMADGAVGFSTGLEYVPGTYATSFEVISLARVAAEFGGMYASHMRNEGTRIEDAIDETIRVGRAAGCPVEISHLKIDSPNRWGRAARVLQLIDTARAQGVDVGADQYAYTAGSSGLGIRFPAWALEGGLDEIRARLDTPAAWARIKTEMKGFLAERGVDDLSFAVVASYREDPTLNGLSMKQVAEKLEGSGSVDAQLEAARTMLRNGGASMVYHLMSDEDVDAIMRHPWVAVASDSGVLTPGRGLPHPRGYGNNARVLGRYVRQRHVLALAEAIRKMTSLPAGRFHFARRGLVEVGYAADLTVFDPDRVADRATYEDPHEYPAGIPFVLVNGVVVVRNGEHTGARPGQVLAIDVK
jgi:N-acyl-D-amino-acid deacylase